jgi:Uma2 family endonuclease
MGSAAQQSPVSIEEYFRLETASDVRHEYRNGIVVAMAGGTYRHSLITSNVIASLSTRLKGGECRPLESNLRIRIPRKAKYYYSDCLVICGEPQFDPAAPAETTILNPRLIVEVVSDSTEAFDRGDKFTDYRDTESLCEYLLVSQHVPRVDAFIRRADGTWRFHPAAGLEAEVRLDEFGIALPLDEIYAGVTF